MAKQVKQDFCSDPEDIATTLAALIGTVTTYWGHHVLKDGSGRYIITVAYDGT